MILESSPCSNHCDLSFGYYRAESTFSCLMLDSCLQSSSSQFYYSRILACQFENCPYTAALFFQRAKFTIPRHAFRVHVPETTPLNVRWIRLSAKKPRKPPCPRCNTLLPLSNFTPWAQWLLLAALKKEVESLRFYLWPQLLPTQNLIAALLLKFRESILDRRMQLQCFQAAA